MGIIYITVARFLPFYWFPNLYQLIFTASSLFHVQPLIENVTDSTMQATDPSLWAEITLYYHTEICYNPVLEPPNSLCITLAKNHVHSERITQSYLITVTVSTCLVVGNVYEAHSPQCLYRDGVCKYPALCSLSSAVNLIKVLYQASTEGLPQFNAILHGSRWTISLTAELHSSGKFIMLAEYRHPYQKEGAVANALNHIEGKDPCLYFSSSLTCK